MFVNEIFARKKVLQALDGCIFYPNRRWRSFVFWFEGRYFQSEILRAIDPNLISISFLEIDFLKFEMINLTSILDHKMFRRATEFYVALTSYVL